MSITVNSKTVSVILPNYNYAEYIFGRIKEILEQTFPVSEIIILDDASTDNSVEEIRKAIKEIKEKQPKITVKIKINKKNSGNVFLQWQEGIKLATSDYIWIAEADDSAKPDFLKTAMQAFSDKDVVLSYTNSKMIDEQNKIVIKDNLRSVKDAFRKNLLVFNTVPNVSAAVFKNQPCLIDFLNEAKKFGLSGDWLFYIKISQTGKIAHSNKFQNLHRLHQKSVTKTTDTKKRFHEMQEIHQYVLKENLADQKTKNAIKKLEAKLRTSWGL